MNYVAGIFLLSLFLYMPSFACSKYNQETASVPRSTPLQSIADDASSLFYARKFTELDSLALKYRNAPFDTRDQELKIISFYTGTSIPPGLCGKTIEEKDERRWKDHLILLKEWVKSSMNGRSASKIALAHFELNYGWHVRGDEYANKVRDDAWPIFRQRIVVAREVTESIQSEAERDAAWYEVMLSIGLAQGWSREEFNRLFSKAISKYPNCYSLYAIKGDFLRARWYGSEEEFTRYAAETPRIAGPGLKKTIYSRLHWENWEKDMFRNGRADWEKMKAGFAEMLKTSPDILTRNYFGKFACMARDDKTLLEQIDLIGTQVNYSAWGTELYYKQCKNYVEMKLLGKPSKCFMRTDTNQIFCEN